MAVTTSIIVGSIVGPIIAQKIASSGQEHAAETAAASADKSAALQTASTDKALALQKEMFDLQRQDLAPYRALGAGATGRLGELWGFPAAPAAPPSSSVSSAFTPRDWQPGDPLPQKVVEGVPKIVNQVMGQFGRPTGAMPSTGLTVKLQSPDGEVMDVPSEQAPHYLRLGARQIG